MSSGTPSRPRLRRWLPTMVAAAALVGGSALVSATPAAADDAAPLICRDCLSSGRGEAPPGWVLGGASCAPW